MSLVNLGESRVKSVKICEICRENTVDRVVGGGVGNIGIAFEKCDTCAAVKSSVSASNLVTSSFENDPAVISLLVGKSSYPSSSFFFAISTTSMSFPFPNPFMIDSSWRISESLYKSSMVFCSFAISFPTPGYLCFCRSSSSCS